MAKEENIGKQEARDKMVSEQLAGSNHRGRGRTQAEIKRDYAEYNRRKRIAFEAMAKTKKHLVLYLASDGNNPNKKKKFYNMGGDSAIIFAYDLAPRTGKKDVVLRPDLDGTSVKFKYVVSITNLPAWIEKFKKIGVIRVPADNGDTIIYFELQEEYDRDKINMLLKMHRDEVAELNKILFTEKVYPDIHMSILEIREVVYHKLMKMSRDNRVVLQEEILKPVFRLADLNTLMQHGDMETLEAGKEIVKAVDILYDRIKMVEGLGLWELSSCARLGKLAAGLRQQVVGKIINKAENETGK